MIAVIEDRGKKTREKKLVCGRENLSNRTARNSPSRFCFFKDAQQVEKSEKTRLKSIENCARLLYN